MNEKQALIYDRAIKLFKNLTDEKRLAIESKIKNTPTIDSFEFTDEMIKELLNDIVYDSNLFKKCIIPPFSVLDTRQGEWRNRKGLLEGYFGTSVAGRAGSLTYGDGLRVRDQDNGTSNFDPVLCELILKWFGIKGGSVYDSFAGGHIRGTMAHMLGMKYIGIELSREQVEANYKRANEMLLPTTDLNWHNDDSLNANMYVEDDSVDLFFSCPPYGDLEKYTDDERDLSNMTYKNFIEAYAKIIEIGLSKLKDNRFAVFVVGDFRDEKGMYRGFVKDTIKIFQDNNAPLYNELILLNNIGSATLRAGNQWANRKMVKLHQNVLVFFKGDPSTIQNNYTDIDPDLPFTIASQDSLFG